MAPMRFRNFGGIYQFMVVDEDDLAQVDALDPARWAATSAPTRDLHCDEAFLAYIDPGATGRVHVSQLVAARDWLFARLSDRSVVRGRRESIPLAALARDEAGEALRAVALRVNREQGAADSKEVALADVRAFKAGGHKLLANGDGVVPPDAVPDADVAALARDVIATVGAAKDRNGADGVDAAHLDAFAARAKLWLEWRAKRHEVSVWVDDTGAAAALCAKLGPKLEEFFLYCDLLRQEAAPEAALHLTEEELRALRARDAAAVEAYLAASPLATPNPGGLLDLDGPVNAVYRDDVAALRAKVLARALGPDVRSLTRDAWRRARAHFEAWYAWEKAAPAEPFDKLGEERVRSLLDGPLPARLAELVERDRAAAPEFERVDDLEKLLLYVRWLVDLANNMVSFSSIYHPAERSLVEAGSLVIDGRRLDFCVRVANRAAHRPVAAESLIFLVYVEIFAKEGDAAAFTVVAPVTGGEKGRLVVGKHGLFIDHRGREWDARVVEVVENPISVREAMFAPFRRAAKFVTEKIESWVGAASEAHQERLMSHTTAATEAARARVAAAPGAPPLPGPPPAPPAPPAPGPEGLNINTLVLGGGVALAGLGAMLAGVLGMLTSLKGWGAIVGVVGAVLALSALNAWLKLRKRDMSVLLEAGGWAVNVRTGITARIARVFTYTPELPKGAVIDRKDLLPAVKDEDEGNGGAVFVVAFVAVMIAAAIARAWWLQYRGR